MNHFKKFLPRARIQKEFEDINSALLKENQELEKTRDGMNERIADIDRVYYDQYKKVNDEKMQK
ncbi:hypothetical protein [Ruegeria sediminis]|uniref:hypothetical protein n=1 Tax=Ruegeria sediminis TaxID=2583820 RepID=UPI001C556BBF|nr:hypothetical protein [Ruegeria sediminis]